MFILHLTNNSFHQIPLDVPLLSTYNLVVNGSGGLTFNKSQEVSVTAKSLSLFVQTDKAQYKPGQIGKERKSNIIFK